MDWYIYILKRPDEHKSLFVHKYVVYFILMRKWIKMFFEETCIGRGRQKGFYR